MRYSPKNNRDSGKIMRMWYVKLFMFIDEHSNVFYLELNGRDISIFIEIQTFGFKVICVDGTLNEHSYIIVHFQIFTKFPNICIRKCGAGVRLTQNQHKTCKIRQKNINREECPSRYYGVARSLASTLD